MSIGMRLLRAKQPAAMTGLLFSTLLLADASAADLSVKPRLCITNSAQKVCDLELEFHWQAQRNGDYCLIQSAGQQTLQCWRQNQQGQWQATRSVQDQELFVLTEDGQPAPLAQTVIEVLSTYSEDRRRNRRRKHVWSLM